MWFAERLRQGPPVSNINLVLRRRGPTDAAQLRSAFAALVARHESLRTTLREGLEGPEQVVHTAPGEVPLHEADLSGLPPAEREPALERLQGQDAREAFDLSRWPLLRLRLVHLDEDEHALVLIAHRAMVDGVSLQVISAEIAELYSAAVAGQEPKLPPLRLQYVDYTAWKAGQLAGPEARESVAWWRESFAGIPVLGLMRGRPRPTGLATGADRTEHWEPGFRQRLDELGRRSGTSLFMTALAGYAVLLSRYSGVEDVAVGAPMSDRPSRDLGRVVGNFANLVGLRVDLSGDPTFTELLARVRTSTLGSLSHQAIPFEQVVEAVRPERAPEDDPLCQAALSLVQVDNGVAEHRSPDFWTDRYEFSNGSARHDVFLVLNERPDGWLSVTLEWRVGLLPDETSGALLGQLRTLLEAAADAPGTRLSHLPLLTRAQEAEAQSLVDQVGEAPAADTLLAGRVLGPWEATRAVLAPGETVVLDGPGWSAWLARRWAADGIRLLRSWAPSATERPVLAGPWQDAPGAPRAPLGRPLPGVRVRVLDGAGRPVPVAVPGELHVVVGDAAQRATGVLMRVLPDGQLEYVAPVRAPIRVRGYPVDPETVEAVLLDHAEVIAASVTVHDDLDDTYLEAYVSLQPDAQVTGADLHAYLARRLSPYELPVSVMVLADPTLGEDGSLVDDRLPAAFDGLVAPVPVPPRTEVERQLATIWAAVLGHDEVGVTDNFFALGGDSFSSLQVVAGAAEAGLALSAVDVFSRQTIAELARGLTEGAAGGDVAEGAPVPAAVLRRLDPRPVLLAELDRPLDPAALAEWGPVRMEPAESAAGPVRLVGDGALLDDWTWTSLLASLATGAELPPAPAAMSLPVIPPKPSPAGEGPGLVGGAWSASQVDVPLDLDTARAVFGLAPVDLIVTALAAVLPGPSFVVEVSDADRVLAEVGSDHLNRPAGRWARDVRASVPAGAVGTDMIRSVKESLRAAARDDGGTAESPYVEVTMVPALPAGVRDIDDGTGALVAPLDVRARISAGSVEMVLRGLASHWPPDELRALADRAGAALRAVADAVAVLPGRVHTPSDFPEAGLSQDQLDRLLGRLSDTDR